MPLLHKALSHKDLTMTETRADNEASFHAAAGDIQELAGADEEAQGQARGQRFT